MKNCIISMKKLLQSNNRNLSNFPPMFVPDTDILLSKMTLEQRKIYDTIILSVSLYSNKLFSLYGYGGTRKILLWRPIYAKIRYKGEIVLIVASSRIITLLILGAELISRTKLIIWNEARMTHKHWFETIDKSFSDVLTLSKNRLQSGFSNEDVSQFKEFVDWITIDILSDVLIENTYDPMSTIINNTYLSLLENMTNTSFFSIELF
ncbi:hypothetical protein HKD37_05G013243 [Glycine soja]